MISCKSISKSCSGSRLMSSRGGISGVKSSSSLSISLNPYLGHQSLSLESSSLPSFLFSEKKTFGFYAFRVWIKFGNYMDYRNGILKYVWFLFMELSVQNIIHGIYLYRMLTTQILFRYYVVCLVIQTNLSFGRSSVCRFAVFLSLLPLSSSLSSSICHLSISLSLPSFFLLLSCTPSPFFPPFFLFSLLECLLGSTPLSSPSPISSYPVNERETS